MSRALFLEKARKAENGISLILMILAGAGDER
jgi:hypothetical protein